MRLKGASFLVPAVGVCTWYTYNMFEAAEIPDQNSELDNLAKEYGFPLLNFVREPEKGISTKNLIVEDEGENTFFVKKHKKADLQRIENAEKAASFVVEASDVPVILPMKNRIGQLHTNIAGEFYSVFPYISHTEYRPSEGDRIAYTYQLGEMLGKIHSVSRSSETPESVRSISAWASQDREVSITRLEAVGDLIREKVSQDDYDKKALDFVELKTTLLRKSAFVEQAKELTICHGDYHSGNLLFDEDGVMIGICDWDISGLANPYEEFIRSFNMCVIRRDFDHFESKKDVAKAFLDGYRSTCGSPFQIEELKYAVEAWYEKLLTSLWPLSDHYYSKHFKTDPSLDSEYTKICFLHEKRHRLLDFIAQCV